MNRRFVWLLVMLAIALQGPILAYAGVASAKTMAAPCTGHALSQSGNDDSSCCPQRIAPGVCCAGGTVLTAIPSALPMPPMVPSRFVPSASGSVAFATQRSIPLLRPPIT
jgi:hypothetical protein